MTISDGENVRNIDTIVLILSIILSCIAIIATIAALADGLVVWQWIIVFLIWGGAAFTYDHVEGKFNLAYAITLLSATAISGTVLIVSVIRAIILLF